MHDVTLKIKVDDVIKKICIVHVECMNNSVFGNYGMNIPVSIFIVL